MLWLRGPYLVFIFALHLYTTSHRCFSPHEQTKYSGPGYLSQVYILWDKSLSWFPEKRIWLKYWTLMFPPISSLILAFYYSLDIVWRLYGVIMFVPTVITQTQQNTAVNCVCFYINHLITLTFVQKMFFFFHPGKNNLGENWLLVLCLVKLQRCQDRLFKSISAAKHNKSSF